MMLRFVFFFFLAAGAVLFASDDTHAQACPDNPIHGHWQNIRLEFNTLSRVEIIQTCDHTGPYGSWKVRAFEKCAPRDCSWGWTRGQFDERGRFLAKFATFTAERHIELDPRSLRMRAKVTTDYRDQSKEDERQSFILIKQAR